MEMTYNRQSTLLVFQQDQRLQPDKTDYTVYVKVPNSFGRLTSEAFSIRVAGEATPENMDRAAQAAVEYYNTQLAALPSEAEQKKYVNELTFFNSLPVMEF